MADISVTASAVVASVTALVEHGGKAGATITAGQVLYKDSSDGKLKLADNDSGTAAVRTVYGIALHASLDGQPLSVIKRGPLTLNAIRQYAPRDLILGMHAARMKFLMGLSNWDVFGEGWTKRCEAMRDLALSLAPAEAPAVVAAKAKSTSKVVGTVTTAAAAVVATGPLVVQALPTAKVAFDQARTTLGPLGDLAPWMQYVVLGIAGGIGAAALWLAVEGMNCRCQPCTTAGRWMRSPPWLRTKCLRYAGLIVLAHFLYCLR